MMEYRYDPSLYYGVQALTTENPSGYRQKLLNQGHMEPETTCFLHSLFLAASVLINNSLRWIIVILSVQSLDSLFHST